MFFLHMASRHHGLWFPLTTIGRSISGFLETVSASYWRTAGLALWSPFPFNYTHCFGDPSHVDALSTTSTARTLTIISLYYIQASVVSISALMFDGHIKLHCVLQGLLLCFIILLDSGVLHVVAGSSAFPVAENHGCLSLIHMQSLAQY